MRGAGVALAALLLAGGAQARDRIDADDCSAAIKGANNTTTIVCGDQTIVVGYTEEQFTARLEARTAELSVQVTALQAAVVAVPTLAEELTLKRAALAEAERQLTDTDSAFAESVALNEELRREIVALRAEGSGGVGAAKFEEALDALAKGDRAAADALLAELQSYAPDLEAIARQARIAYERGRIAEAEIDYLGAMTQYMRAARLEPENYEYLLKAQRYAREAGKYDLSARMGEELLSVSEAQFGSEANETGIALDGLASSYQLQGEYAAAEPLHKRSLAIVERYWGRDHPEVAIALNNLASLYAAQSNYAAAEALYERSLAIKERFLDADHLETAKTLNNLAGVYRAQGYYAAAEQLYERSLAIKEQSLGANHPSVAISLNNLAGLYEARGDYAVAKSFYERSLAINERTLGSDHPEVATSLNNLAGFYKGQGEYTVAEPLYKRSLAISEGSFGSDHPEVATTLNNLAGLYRAQGDYTVAEPLYERSLEIKERSLGIDHPDVAITLGSLAGLYAVQGDYAVAEQLHRRALAIFRVSLGDDHPYTQITVANFLYMLNEAPETPARREEIEALEILQ